ncbi:MAG TPA: tetratricopeptide repeat protein [Motiliproteus sp.]
MSLVNDMLRDLDQRREKPATAAPLSPSAAAGVAASKPKNRWPLLAAGGAVVVGVVVWSVLNPPKAPVTSVGVRSATLQPPKPKAVEPAVPVGLPKLELPSTDADPSAAAVSKVTAISWHRDGGSMQLMLDTSVAVAQQLQSIDNRELVLNLGAVLLDSPVPTLPQELIQQFTLESRAEQLQLRLISQVPVNFQIHPLQQGERHRLQIVVEPRQPLVAAVTPISPVVTAAAAAVPTSNAAVAPAQPAKARTEPPAQPQPSAQPTLPATATAAAKPAAQRGSSLPTAPLRKQTTPTLAQRDQDSRSAAVVLIRKGEVQEALALLSQQVAAEIDAHRSRALLATLLISRQQVARAEALLDQGLERLPGDAELRKLKARLLLQRSESNVAAALLQAELPAPDSDPEFHQIKAAAEQQAGLHEAASRTYHALLQSDATNPAWWVGLGISLEALQQLPSARQAYQNVLQIPQAPASLSGYARKRLLQLGG